MNCSLRVLIGPSTAIFVTHARERLLAAVPDAAVGELPRPWCLRVCDTGHVPQREEHGGLLEIFEEQIPGFDQ